MSSSTWVVCRVAASVSSSASDPLGFGSLGWMWTRSPKLLSVRRHGGYRNGSIRSWSYDVCAAMSRSGVVLLLSVADPFSNLALSGGGVDGLVPERHVSGSRWRIGFLWPSLLNRIAHCLMCCWICIRIGGINASISSASVEVVLKAAHIR